MTPTPSEPKKASKDNELEKALYGLDFETKGIIRARLKTLVQHAFEIGIDLGHQLSTDSKGMKKHAKRFEKSFGFRP